MADTVVYMGAQQTFSFAGTSLFGFCTVGKHGTHLEREGTRGTRSHDIDDVVSGANTVSGQIIMQPSNTELNLLEPYIIGSGGTVDEGLSNASLLIDRGNAVYTYSNCKISRAVYTGRQGELITLTCDVIGRIETVAGSAPSEPTSATPFWFDDIVFTLQATAREVKEFELVVDNMMLTDRFNQNATVIDQPEQDRVVTLRTVHDHSSNTASLYGEGIAGAAGTLAWSGGGDRTYTFGALQVPDESPPLADKGALQLTLNMTARKTNGAKEIART